MLAASVWKPAIKKNATATVATGRPIAVKCFITDVLIISPFEFQALPRIPHAGGPCHQTYFQDLTACFFYAVSFHCNPRVSIKLRLALQQTCANIAEKVLLAIQIINAVV
jgi:hypothetical protein